MKKLLILGSTFAMGLCAVGIAVGAGQAREVKAGDLDGDKAAALKSLLTGYNDGGYTKLTTFYLTEAARSETQFFHNGANALQRATYYNADESALLMGDYSGSFGTINSGYMNDGEGNANHFKYLGDAAPDVDKLFDDIKADWKASGQTVGGYYQTLTSLADSIPTDGSGWWYDDSHAHITYGHTITNLKIVDGEYDDPILKRFQYFAAPMMLQNSYFSWSSVRVQDTTDFLSIRLYSSVLDAEKSTLVGVDEVLISEARIFKGISLEASNEVQYYLKGDFNDWGTSDPLETAPDLYECEPQYRIQKDLPNWKNFKISGSDDSWYGYTNVENKDHFRTFQKDDCQAVYSGIYTMYFKPHASDSQNMIYMQFDEIDYDFESWSSWDQSIADATFRVVITYSDDSTDDLALTSYTATKPTEWYRVKFALRLPTNFKTVQLQRRSADGSELWNITNFTNSANVYELKGNPVNP